MSRFKSETLLAAVVDNSPAKVARGHNDRMRRHTKCSAMLREHLVDEQRVARWIATLELRPSTALPAARRLDLLTARVKAKTATP